MSDSLPPARGRSHYAERDLEAVLSGDTAGLRPALQPAAAVMAALRAAPVPGELTGEAAARAAYRLFVLPDGDWAATTAGHPASPPPPPVAAGRPHSHRRSRPLPWAGRRPSALLVGAAAMAACVVALACVLVLPGSGSGQPGRPANSHAASSASANPVLEGGGSKAPTPAATPTAAASHAPAAPASTSHASAMTALCHQYWSYLAHPWPPGRYLTTGDWKQLITAAQGLTRVYGYCASLAGGQPRLPSAPRPGSGSQPYSGYPPAGSQPYSDYPPAGRQLPGQHAGAATGPGSISQDDSPQAARGLR